MNNLIICPVGSKLSFDERFDTENHWRYTKKNRNYETLVFQYSEFVPEENTYDFLIKQKGFKWSLAKEWLKNNDYSKYDYIGFIDDDIITDIESLNYSLSLAKEKNSKIFQLSVTSDSDMFYKILKNNPDLVYSKTNFVEVMAPFIHTSLIPLCQKLWEKYDIFSGWGFDKVLCDLTKEEATVIHSRQMYHPKRHGNYDKTKAFQEMDLLTQEIFPNFMKETYGEEWEFNDTQKEISLVYKI